MGSVSVPKYNARRLKKYLRGFSAISVREHTSQKLIKAFCGCESVHVLDPVLLVGREFWGQLACDPPQKDKYLFCYFLDNCTDAQNIIRLARANNLQVLWVQMGTDIPDGAEGVCPSPAEFVSLMQNAEYVFTDSFHACCFSALFEKSFYVIRRNYQGYPAQHIRIQELLSTLQMNERHLDSCAQLERLQPIAEERFRLAQSRFTERRTVSERFLEDALQNI